MSADLKKNSKPSRCFGELYLCWINMATSKAYKIKRN